MAFARQWAETSSTGSTERETRMIIVYMKFEWRNLHKVSFAVLFGREKPMKK